MALDDQFHNNHQDNIYKHTFLNLLNPSQETRKVHKRDVGNYKRLGNHYNLQSDYLTTVLNPSKHSMMVNNYTNKEEELEGLLKKSKSTTLVLNDSNYNDINAEYSNNNLGTNYQPKCSADHYQMAKKNKSYCPACCSDVIYEVMNDIYNNSTTADNEFNPIPCNHRGREVGDIENKTKSCKSIGLDTKINEVQEETLDKYMEGMKGVSSPKTKVLVKDLLKTCLPEGVTSERDFTSSQISDRDETCTCPCNSDIIFDIMKGIYECYKRGNCDNCNCYLCNRLEQKDNVHDASCKPDTDILEKQGYKFRRAISGMEGKSFAEKEEILKVLVRSFIPNVQENTGTFNGANKISCCRNCNSDLIFEVMKGLYDCYKKADCDKCQCIKCGQIDKAKVWKPHAEIKCKKEITADEIYKLLEGILNSQKRNLEENSNRKSKTETDLSHTQLPRCKIRKCSCHITDKELVNISLTSKQNITAANIRGKCIQEETGPSQLPEIKPVKNSSVYNEGTNLKNTTFKNVKNSKAKTSNKLINNVDKSRPTLAKVLSSPKRKSIKQKMNILKCLDILGIPLPEAQTPSQQRIINQVHNAFGMPFKSYTPSERKRRAILGDNKNLKKIEDEGVKELHRNKSGNLEKNRRGILSAQEINSLEIDELLRRMAMQGIYIAEGKTLKEKRILVENKPENSLSKLFVSSLKNNFTQDIKSSHLQSTQKTPLGTPLKSWTSLEKFKSPSIVDPTGKRLTNDISSGLSNKQKKSILKGIALLGYPLPEGKTTSEKKLIAKVRAEINLSLKPSQSTRRKHSKANEADFIYFQENETHEQNKITIANLTGSKLTLPIKNTFSEKLIMVNAREKPVNHIQKLSASNEKQFQDKSGKGEAFNHKKILTEPATHEKHRHEDKSCGKKLIIKIQADIHPQHKNLTKQKIPHKVENVPKSFLTPMQWCPVSEKTFNVKTTNKTIQVTPIERISRGKYATHEEINPNKMQRTLKSFKIQNELLPEGKTESKNKIVGSDLIDERKPDLISMRNQYTKETETSLRYKYQGREKKLVEGYPKVKIPLPENRTYSERCLIAKFKIKAEKYLKKMKFLEKTGQLNRAGLLSPFESETNMQKKDTLIKLATSGVPNAKAMMNENELFYKVLATLGLPLESRSSKLKNNYSKDAKMFSQKSSTARTASNNQFNMIQLSQRQNPLEKLTAKTKAQIPLKRWKNVQDTKWRSIMNSHEENSRNKKDKIFETSQWHSVLRHVSKTKYGKALIDELSSDLNLPYCCSPPVSQKYTNNDTEFRPLNKQFRTSFEKGIILKRLQNLGLPVSTKDACEKYVIKNLDVFDPTTKPSISMEKIYKAKATGLWIPLQGKTHEQTVHILKGLARIGLPLAEGVTASSKALFDRMKSELKLKIKLSDNECQTTAPSLLIAVESNKNPYGQILQLKPGSSVKLTFPKSETFVKAVKVEKSKRHISCSPFNGVGKAIVSYTITNSKEKSLAEVTKDLAADVLSLHREPSEGNLIRNSERKQKVNKNVDLVCNTYRKSPSKYKKIFLDEDIMPPKITVSEKILLTKVSSLDKLLIKPLQYDGNKNMTKDKKNYVKVAKRVLKDEARKGNKNTVKSISLDKCCGCDLKKVRFKDSYLKIGVSAPDISSISVNPVNCIHIYKPGMYTTYNEGLKLTIGNALGIPKFNTSNLLYTNDNTSSDRVYEQIYYGNRRVLPKYSTTCYGYSHGNQRKLNEVKNIYFHTCEVNNYESEEIFKTSYSDVLVIPCSSCEKFSLENSASFYSIAASGSECSLNSFRSSRVNTHNICEVFSNTDSSCSHCISHSDTYLSASEDEIDMFMKGNLTNPL